MTFQNVLFRERDVNFQLREMHSLKVVIVSLTLKPMNHLDTECVIVGFIWEKAREGMMMQGF
jgi:hypothetical protein